MKVLRTRATLAEPFTERPPEKTTLLLPGCWIVRVPPVPVTTPPVPVNVLTY